MGCCTRLKDVLISIIPHLFIRKKPTMTHLTGTFRLGRDAEKVAGENGDFYNLSLANDVYVRGETQTQWIRVTLGGNRAKNAADHMVKGAQIYAVIKDLHIATFKDKDGNERSALEGRLLDFDFVGPRPSNDAGESDAAQDH